MTTKDQEKVFHIKEMIQKNQKKISKLEIINSLLAEQILSLQEKSQEPKILTKEERISQSQRDSEKFQSRISDGNHRIMSREEISNMINQTSEFSTK